MRGMGWAVGVALAVACGKSSPPANGSTGSSGAAQHTLHLRVSGNGQVLSSSPAFSCRGDCQQTIDSAMNAHLVAVPDSGWKFNGWQGGCSGTGACDVSMNADRDVTATFSATSPPPPGSARVMVTFTGTGSGRVTSSPAGIDCPGTCAMTVTAGSMLSLSAQADANSTFTAWGGGCNGSGGCSVTASSDVSVWAIFTANNPPPGGGGGGPQCAGISAPDAVLMQQYVLHPNGSMACVGGLGDAGGLLAFPSEFNDPNSHGSLIDFVSENNVFLREVYSNSEALHPIQQPGGLASAGDAGHMYPYQPTIRMGRWDTSGNWLGDAVWFAKNFASAGDPAGGVLLAGDLSSEAATTTPTLHHEVVMFNGGGQAFGVKWGPQPLASGGPVFGAGVDNLGRSIVITGGGNGTITAQWFDKNGTPLTGEFVLVTGFTPGQNTWFETSPLIDSGVEVRRMDTDYATGMHAHALALVVSGASTVQPPPTWMIARPDTRLQIARGGKAYAVLPYGAPNVLCTQKVEVVASDGTSCGSRDFPIATGNCFTQDLTMAEDGTVLQQLPAAMESVTDPIRNYHTCTWRWWTRAVK